MVIVQDIQDMQDVRDLQEVQEFHDLHEVQDKLDMHDEVQVMQESEDAPFWCGLLSQSGYDFYLKQRNMKLKAAIFRKFHNISLSHLMDKIQPNSNIDKWKDFLNKLPEKNLKELAKDSQSLFHRHHIQTLAKEKPIPSDPCEMYFFMLEELIDIGGSPCTWRVSEHDSENGLEYFYSEELEMD